MKLAIVIPSQLPVPAVKGGAVETLVTGLIDQNEEKRLIDITVFSTYDREAVLESKKYEYTRFIWIRYNILNKIINVITRIYSKISKESIPHFGILQIIYYLKKIQFDLILLEGNVEIIIPLEKVAGKEKIFFHLHAATLFSKPQVFNYCRKIIVVSNYIKRLVVMKTERINKDVVVLENCTDIPRFSRENNLKFREKTICKYGISKDDIVICFTGRIDEQKGIKELIQALLLLPKSLHFKLIIAGSTGLAFGMVNIKTEFYTEIYNLAKNLGDKVIFTGFIKNTEIPQLLAASDISVIPSLGEDAAPLTIFESLAACLPIVTTDSGGIPEYVTDKCAIVVKRDENFVLNLSSSLHELIISKEKREAIGKAGFLHVQKYNYNNYYSNLISILNE